MTGPRLSSQLIMSDTKSSTASTIIESYQVDGEQRYAAIWIKNPDGRDWGAVRDMDTQDYVNQSRRYQDLGYRLTDL